MPTRAGALRRATFGVFQLDELPHLWERCSGDPESEDSPPVLGCYEVCGPAASTAAAGVREDGGSGLARLVPRRRSEGPGHGRAEVRRASLTVQADGDTRLSGGLGTKRKRPERGCAIRGEHGGPVWFRVCEAVPAAHTQHLDASVAFLPLKCMKAVH